MFSHFLMRVGQSRREGCDGTSFARGGCNFSGTKLSQRPRSFLTDGEVCIVQQRVGKGVVSGERGID
jgi:hypothetical protein